MNVYTYINVYMSIFHFLCTTFGQISPPCFWAQNFWNLRFAEKAGLHISSWDGIHFTFLVEDGWHFTFLFTVQNDVHKSSSQKKKVCISWQLKPPWRLCRDGCAKELTSSWCQNGLTNIYPINQPTHNDFPRTLFGTSPHILCIGVKTSDIPIANFWRSLAWEVYTDLICYSVV